VKPLKPTPKHNLNRNHKAIGEYSEAIIRAKLVEIGYSVFKPFGDNLRYDLVIEDAEGQFWRIQCKTAWMDKQKSVIKFATASSYNYTMKNKVWRHYRGQCEYFAVYCPETEKVYFVSVDEVGVTQTILRLAPTANNQEKGVRWAKDYEI
jgi:PD-(D/E)XK nuclease superfamily protein